MDNFKLPDVVIDHDDPLSWDEDHALGKLYKSAQFVCLPVHVGLAVAMKNFWIHHYAIASNKNLY